MEKQVNKTNIIIMALIYNYVSNRSKSISVENIDKFKDAMDFEMVYNQGKETISNEEDKQFSCYGNVYRYDIDSSNNKCVVFNDQCDLGLVYYRYIDSLPQYIVLASLKENVLNSIGVDRKNLRIKTVSKHKEGIVNTKSFEMDTAKASAKELLESLGKKNINVGFRSLDQFPLSTGYRVSVSYEEDHFYLDLSDNNKDYGKSLMKKIDSLF